MTIKKHSIINLCIIFIIAFAVDQSFSEVVVGSGELTYGNWDFYLMQSTPFPAQGHVQCILSYPGRILAGFNGALIASFPNTSFDDLLYAPSNSASYDGYQMAVDRRVYVIKIRNPSTQLVTYTKIRWPSYDHRTMDYLYQPNGSLDLFDDRGIRVTSWGRIKALMRL